MTETTFSFQRVNFADTTYLCNNLRLNKNIWKQAMFEERYFQSSTELKLLEWFGLRLKCFDVVKTGIFDNSEVWIVLKSHLLS